jgi:hypothetical protein
MGKKKPKRRYAMGMVKAIEFWYEKTKQELKEVERRFCLEKKFFEEFLINPDRIYFEGNIGYAEAILYVEEENLTLLDKKIKKFIFRLRELKNGSSTVWNFYEYKDYFLWKKYDIQYLVEVEIWFE